MTAPLDLAVVGGGIAGLVVALEAATAGARVHLLEAGDETGGMLRRGRLAGLDVDQGAESFAIRTDAVARLVADHALPLEIVSPRETPARLVVPRGAGRHDRLPLPRRTVIGIPADPLADDVVAIIGRRAAERAAVEDRSVPVDEGDSLGALVTARLGAGLAQRLVDPLCRSVYSQPADAAPLARLHPRLWEEFVRSGSLLEAAAAVAPKTATGAAVRGLRGGMWRLAATVDRLARESGAQIRTGARVRSIDGAHGDARIVLDSGETLHAAHVVLATGPRATSGLLDAPVPPSRDAVHLTTAVVRSTHLSSAPVGSGVIVAPEAHTVSKAMTHMNAKWEWIGDALDPDTHLVRFSARDAARTLGSSAEVVRELRRLTGARVGRGDVGEVVTTSWHDAVVPAATPAWTQALTDAADRGIRVTGAAVAGTGLASVIPHAREIAREIFSPSGETTRPYLRKEPS